jgi:hypothetical protein
MIHGMAFKDWYHSIYRKRTLAINEAFCITCRVAVNMEQPSPNVVNGLSYMLAECPECGRSLSRIIDMDRTKL